MTYETPLRIAGRFLLAGLMVTMGVLHFTHAESFVSIVPGYLPWPVPLVLISGAFELVLGSLLLLERTRTLAAYGLVALFLAVLPANINMALHPEVQIAGLPAWLPQPSATALWLRLPLQLVFIGWALQYTRRRTARG
ncbi:MAG: DoxX family protein [Myxococcaceae bacterium]|nr:DoxX family protein [Myxococcaceae bacterium]